MDQVPFIRKTALVTGGCGGLGRTIAEAFLVAGANVVVCDINTSLIADFKENVSAAYPECTLVHEADITKDENIHKLFDEGEKMFGSIDYVINCAGRIDGFHPIGDIDRAMWDKVIALNLTAPAMVSQRAVKAWIKAEKKGAIVNIASIAGFRGFTCGAAYTASKHGLIGLTKNTGAFYGSKGIRCNAIMAGAMETNIGDSLRTEGMSMEGMARMRENFPDSSMQLCDKEHVAKLVQYLCSDAAEIVNGAAWVADKGATAN